MFFVRVCVCVGGEEQSESHLEEVFCSSADVLQQRPRQTAEGSANQNPPLVKSTNQDPPSVINNHNMKCLPLAGGLL